MTNMAKRVCAAAAAAAVTMTQAGVAVSAFADDGKMTRTYAESSTAAVHDEEIPDDKLPSDGETTGEEDHARGDVNGDNKVDSADVILAAAYLKGQGDLTAKARKAADADLNGVVDVKDITVLAAHVKGIRAMDWLEHLETVTESDVKSEPEKYERLEYITVEHKDQMLKWDAVPDAMGYTVTCTAGGEEITLANTQSAAEAKLQIGSLGKADMATVKVKPFKYVNTESRQGVKSYLDGYEQDVLFIPDDISSGIKVKSVPKSVTLSWSAASCADTYEVYYTVSGQKEKLYTTTNKTSCDVKVETEKDYSFRVLPVNNVKTNGKDIAVKAKKSATASVHTLPYYELAAKKLDQVGWDLKAAFDWCASMSYNSNGLYNDGRSGTDYYANYGFTHGYGNCYVMAACFYQMASMLGYDAHQIQSFTWRNSGYWGNHSWVEIDNFNGSGKTYIFDPDFTVETGKNGYAITYGDKGTWRYDYYGEYSKKRMN